MKIFIQRDNMNRDGGFYMVPDTALSRINTPLFLPDYARPCMAGVHAVVRISRLGKCVDKKFAHRYYKEVTLGVACVAEELEKELVGKGVPADPARGFDGAVHLGSWRGWDEAMEDGEMRFALNGEEFSRFALSDLLKSVDEQVEELSKYYRLCQGDLLFLGMGGRTVVDLNDVITGGWGDGDAVLRFKIK